MDAGRRKSEVLEDGCDVEVVGEFEMEAVLKEFGFSDVAEIEGTYFVCGRKGIERVEFLRGEEVREASEDILHGVIIVDDTLCFEFIKGFSGESPIGVSLECAAVAEGELVECVSEDISQEWIIGLFAAIDESVNDGDVGVVGTIG